MDFVAGTMLPSARASSPGSIEKLSWRTAGGGLSNLSSCKQIEQLFGASVSESSWVWTPMWNESRICDKTNSAGRQTDRADRMRRRPGC